MIDTHTEAADRLLKAGDREPAGDGVIPHLLMLTHQLDGSLTSWKVIARRPIDKLIDLSK